MRIHYTYSFRLNLLVPIKLFMIIDVPTLQGVYLAPLSWPAGPYHTQVVENFRAACQIIHR
jgi:hypothetical protein